MTIIREYMSEEILFVVDIQSDFEDLDGLVDSSLSLKERASLLDIIEAGSGQKYVDLVELIAEIEEAGADREEMLLTEKGMLEGIKSDINDVEVPSWLVVDMEATIDNLKQDYTECEIDGYTFYSL